MLTELQCRSAKAREKDYKISDANGLYLYVTTKGYRSWRWKYRFHGKEKRLVLGQYPEVSLKQAREFRVQAAATLKLGKDPGIIKQISPSLAPNFEATARTWHNNHKSLWTTKHEASMLKSLEDEVFPILEA